MQRKILLAPADWDGPVPEEVVAVRRESGRESLETTNIETVDRDAISQHSKDRFQTARANGDLQTQLDVLYEILTGDDPTDSNG